jgi:hypothetical protein
LARRTENAAILGAVMGASARRAGRWARGEEEEGRLTADDSAALWSTPGKCCVLAILAHVGRPRGEECPCLLCLEPRSSAANRIHQGPSGPRWVTSLEGGNTTGSNKSRVGDAAGRGDLRATEHQPFFLCSRIIRRVSGLCPGLGAAIDRVVPTRGPSGTPAAVI